MRPFFHQVFLVPATWQRVWCQLPWPGGPSFPLQSVRVESTLSTVTHWEMVADRAAAAYPERGAKTKEIIRRASRFSRLIYLP